MSKKSITLALDIEEIKYDIKNKAYLTGETKGVGGADYRAVSQMQVSDDADIDYRINRSIVNSITRIKSEFSEVLHGEQDTVSNVQSLGGTVTFTLMMPTNFSSVSCEELVGLLHEYIVGRALTEWFMITNPGDSEMYNLQTESTLVRARQLLYKRERPVRDSN